MNRKFIIAAAVAAVAVASSAHSAPLTIDFCTGTGSADCLNDGIAEARLTIDEIVDGDINNYTATLFFLGAASGAPAAIDQVQFTIDQANQADYEGPASLISAPGGTVGDPNGDWTPYFGGVPGCGGPGNPNSVCAVGPAALFGNNGTLTWVFTFDLIDSFGALAPGHLVNMRASYGQGQFSPTADELGTTTSTPTTTTSNPTTTTSNPTTTTSNPTTTTTPTTGSVPEPGTLALMGLGLFGLSRRLRRA